MTFTSSQVLILLLQTQSKNDNVVVALGTVAWGRGGRNVAPRSGPHLVPGWCNRLHAPTLLPSEHQCVSSGVIVWFEFAWACASLRLEPVRSLLPNLPSVPRPSSPIWSYTSPAASVVDDGPVHSPPPTSCTWSRNTDYIALSKALLLTFFAPCPLSHTNTCMHLSALQPLCLRAHTSA